jgi:hypothetical protein
MKRFLLILTLLIFTKASVNAQDDGGEDKIRDRMREFIQKRMDLTKAEAEKFTPVFIRYFREWRTTLRENKGGDRLILQQKIIELKLRYRPEFKEILGEKRCNEVYKHQDDFIREIDQLRRERRDRINNKPVRVQGLSPI